MHATDIDSRLPSPAPCQESCHLSTRSLFTPGGVHEAEHRATRLFCKGSKDNDQQRMQAYLHAAKLCIGSSAIIMTPHSRLQERGTIGLCQVQIPPCLRECREHKQRQGSAGDL